MSQRTQPDGRRSVPQGRIAAVLMGVMLCSSAAAGAVVLLESRDPASACGAGYGQSEYGHNGYTRAFEHGQGYGHPGYGNGYGPGYCPTSRTLPEQAQDPHGIRDEDAQTEPDAP